MNLPVDARAIVLSPHLDDAVFSCFHVLSQEPKPLVVNFFCGLPPDGDPTVADRMAGAPSSAELVRWRLEEDQRALSHVGCEAVYMEFVEDQYRTDPVEIGDLERALAPYLADTTVLFAPAAVGAHPDHRLIRQAALLLSRELEVHLYADIPYAVRYGWPQWVTGIDTGPHLAIEPYWEDFLSEIREHDLTPTRHDLGDALSDEKLAAMLMYATQFPQLNSGVIDRLRNPAIRRYEVSWKVS